MEVLAKGQLSYMILSCLSERDMYGLELIEEMKARYGREIKLPSLYSNLNRMKELKYISSYLKESTKGPKCSYSSITNAGREALKELENDFRELAVVKPVEKPQDVNVFEQALRESNIFTPAADENKEETDMPSIQEVSDEEQPVQTPIDNDEQEDEPQQLADDYDDYFAVGDDEEESQPTFAIQSKMTEDAFDADDEEIEAEESEENGIDDEDEAEELQTNDEENDAPALDDELTDEEQLDDEESSEESVAEEFISEQESAKEVEEDSQQEAQSQVAAADAGEYNQKIYAAAKDFSKNKNKRSYSENQIALALNTTPARSEENKRQSLSQLKEALINSRQGYYEGLEERFAPKPAEVQPEIKPIVPVAKTEELKEEKKDDGVFITDRIDESAMPKPKRIEPARLNVTLPAQGYDSKLPAPKRNVSVDPTCKDVKAKLESLYAKAEVKKEPVVESGDFEDYDDLKKYYTSQEVEFKVYERAEKRPKHNTNRLKLFVSLFVLGLIGVGSALLYMIFSLSGVTKPETNFVYYLFPIIALVYVICTFYNYKTTVSKVPSKMMHPAIVWTIFALLIAVIFLINYACGAAFDVPATYFSTILVPIYDCACATVGLYYAQIFAYKKFWI